MFNAPLIQQVVHYIASLDGQGDKAQIARAVQAQFHLARARSVYFCADLALRFCRAQKPMFSNTVLSLSALQAYDSRPFLVCVVTPSRNYLLLANSSFLHKISHSSQDLTPTHIRGSFNGGDIMRQWEGLANIPENFERLFAAHQRVSFQDNVQRLSAATQHISPTGVKFRPTPAQQRCILESVARAEDFCRSGDYRLLQQDLSGRVRQAQEAIERAACVENVNLRGRVIECLLTGDDAMKRELTECLQFQRPLPPLFTADKLGDYERRFDAYITATDIKTKVLHLSSCPKGYNVDKLLRFLAQDKSVYLLYLVGIDEGQPIRARLCSIYQPQLLAGTRVIAHWAGRNSRGVTQFAGSALEAVLAGGQPEVDVPGGEAFLKHCLQL